MKKRRSIIIPALALIMAICAVSFGNGEIKKEVTAYGPNAYLMFANGDWSVQNNGVESAKGITVYPAEIRSEGFYSVALEFDIPSEGVSFAAIGIKNGEHDLPGATIRIDAIRINDKPIEFSKGYTTSDDGAETRMNIYREWGGDVLPEEARSWDGSLEGASSMILDPALFMEVTLLEVDFTVFCPSQD